MIRSEKYINQHKEDTPMTQAQATTIREMAMAEKSNAEIIEATGLPAAEVYAFRSKHGITRDKVKALLTEQATIKIGTTKADFVRGYLKPLLKAIDCGIVDTVYNKYDDGSELVCIKRPNDTRQYINVTAEVKRHRADTYDRKAAITAVVDKLLKPDEPKFKPGDIVEVRGAHGLPDGVRGRIDGGRGIYGAWLVDFGVKYPCTHRGTGDILPDPTGWYCLETDLKKVEG